MIPITKIGNQAGLPNRMRIQQLDPDQSETTEPHYDVLVNPTSYSVTHAACYDKNQKIQGTGTTYSFNKVKPQGMNIDLLFDSTGSLGNIPTVANKSVLEQINEFMAIAFMAQGKDEKPKLLHLIWGEMMFKGVLENIDITYSHFDPTGAPIRATAKCSFTGGSLRFKEGGAPKVVAIKTPLVVVNFSMAKHPVNVLQKHGGYIAAVSKQVKKTMPKSLRKVEEVAKMIIK
ncbi:MAG: hypothetical protein HRT57_13370 [Crocinitomicaceae bacterium]|nr:hypothetical protein [Crocinitomicaceae bacterium]